MNTLFYINNCQQINITYLQCHSIFIIWFVDAID